MKSINSYNNNGNSNFIKFFMSLLIKRNSVNLLKNVQTNIKVFKKYSLIDSQKKKKMENKNISKLIQKITFVIL